MTTHIGEALDRAWQDARREEYARGVKDGKLQAGRFQVLDVAHLEALAMNAWRDRDDVIRRSRYHGKTAQEWQEHYLRMRDERHDAQSQLQITRTVATQRKEDLDAAKDLLREARAAFEQSERERNDYARRLKAANADYIAVTKERDELSRKFGNGWCQTYYGKSAQQWADQSGDHWRALQKVKVERDELSRKLANDRCLTYHGRSAREWADDYTRAKANRDEIMEAHNVLVDKLRAVESSNLALTFLGRTINEWADIADGRLASLTQAAADRNALADQIYKVRQVLNG